MKENFELKGVWFLPSAPSLEISGILTYDLNEGCSLELFGNFQHDILPEFKDEELILGLTNDSKEITLYKCQMTRSGGAKFVSGGDTGMPHTFFSINFVLIGALVSDIAQLKFQQIKSKIENLDEWVGISGFKNDTYDLEAIKKNRTEGVFDVHYKLPDQIKFEISDGVEGQFNFVIQPPGRTIFQKELNVKQRVQFIVTYVSDLSLEKLLEYIVGFQNFLILALYRKTFPISIEVNSSNFVLDLWEDTEPSLKPIVVHFVISNSKSAEKLQMGKEMMFNYLEIQDEFPNIIKNWFAKYERLEPAGKSLLTF